jgi:hypothetical protein
MDVHYLIDTNGHTDGIVVQTWFMATDFGLFIAFPVCMKYKVSGNPLCSIPETTLNVLYSIGKRYKKVAGISSNIKIHSRTTGNSATKSFKPARKSVKSPIKIRFYWVF